MSNKTKTTKSEQIAILNDRARRALGAYPNSRVLITEGISALEPAERSAIAEKVQAFDQFSIGDDPYGEHDFGAFDHNGNRVFWKIDYYGLDLESGSEEPADASKTVRVLTIMLADEY